MPGTAAIVSDKATLFGVTFVVGELASHNGGVGEVKACAMEHGKMLFVVERLRLQRQVAPRCSIFVRGDGIAVWPAIAVTHAFAWRARPNGTLFVIVK